MSSEMRALSRPTSAAGRKDTMPPLVIDNVVGGYGGAPVLNGLSLTVGQGERVGLFGPNGHGKTTLLRAISGLIRPASGEISFEGARLTRMSPRQIVDRGLVQSPQGNTLFPRMTV